MSVILKIIRYCIFIGLSSFLTFVNEGNKLYFCFQRKRGRECVCDCLCVHVFILSIVLLKLFKRGFYQMS